MRPALSRSDGSAARVTWSAPKKFTSMMRRNTDASVSATKLRWVRPALATRTSMPPNRAATPSTAARTPSRR